MYTPLLRAGDFRNGVRRVRQLGRATGLTTLEEYAGMLAFTSRLDDHLETVSSLVTFRGMFAGTSGERYSPKDGASENETRVVSFDRYQAERTLDSRRARRSPDHLGRAGYICTGMVILGDILLGRQAAVLLDAACIAEISH
jgi:hypothetical protein